MILINILTRFPITTDKRIPQKILNRQTKLSGWGNKVRGFGKFDFELDYEVIGMKINNTELQ